MAKQIYEDYWKITLAYTDFNSHRFISSLRTVLNFIDRSKDEPYSEEKNNELQVELNRVAGLNMASIRKIINQFIKLGFINPYYESYHKDANAYVNARTNEQRKILLSRIVYSNASFRRAVTRKSNEKEIKLLIKTLESVDTLTKEDIMALIQYRPSQVPKGYLTRSELDHAKSKASKKGFNLRKYNQIGYLWNLLGKLDGLYQKRNKLWLEDAVRDVIDEPLVGKRDKYLHQIYKKQLKEESQEMSGMVQCMVERLDYPGLIASHIKPFRVSKKHEKYDPNNGLLLSLNMDQLFDRGLISFNEDGSIIVSKRLNAHTKNLYDHLNSKELNTKYITEERKKYLKYHREKVFN